MHVGETDPIVVLLRAFALCAVFSFPIVDLYLLFQYGTESTISSFLRTIASNWGLFPYLFAFALGALFYHLFGIR